MLSNVQHQCAACTHKGSTHERHLKEHWYGDDALNQSWGDVFTAPCSITPLMLPCAQHCCGAASSLWQARHIHVPWEPCSHGMCQHKSRQALYVQAQDFVCNTEHAAHTDILLSRATGSQWLLSTDGSGRPRQMQASSCFT
jgi:hypothetical protein